MPFGEYETAMERKLRIAKYHMALLADAPDEPDAGGRPPIEYQAHSEATGRSIGSIPDQLASGLVDALRSSVPRMPGVRVAYLHTVAEALPEEVGLRRRVDDLVSDDRYCDLRSWRNRVTHRFDEKYSLEGVWVVKPPDNCDVATQPRDVMAYLGAMPDHGCGYGQSLLRSSILPTNSETETLMTDARKSVAPPRTFELPRVRTACWQGSLIRRLRMESECSGIRSQSRPKPIAALSGPGRWYRWDRRSDRTQNPNLDALARQRTRGRTSLPRSTHCLSG